MPPIVESEPIYFPSQDAFREWLAEHHASAEFLWVGYYKKATGRPSLTWSESVDQALCYGWIDGLRKSVDDERYRIRFTPRRRTSVWSAVNMRKMDELRGAGLMRPPGEKAWEERDPKKAELYSFEQKEKIAFDAAQTAEFKGNEKAWAFFASEPAGYRKNATWWVVSAKREDTRARRLATLIADSEAGVRIKQLRR